MLSPSVPMPLPRRRPLWRRRFSLALGLMLGLGLVVHGQIPTDVPPDQNPNDPFASRAERIRRQEALIQQQLAQHRKQIEEARKKQAEEQRQKLLQAQQAKQSATAPAPAPGAPGGQPAPAPAPGARGGRPGPAAPGTAPGRGRPPAKANDLMTRSSIPYVTFYLSPATVVATRGDRFETKSGLINPDRLQMERVRVVLNYDPACLEPLAIHDEAIRPLLAGNPEVLADPVAGRITYAGVLAKAIGGAELPLIGVEWKALRATDRTQIATGANDVWSGAMQGNKFLSQASQGIADAQLGATVRIEEPSTGLPEGLQFVSRARDEAEPGRATAALPRLWIDQPADRAYRAGEWVVIDLGIDNPGEMPIDEIRLAGRFDPESVEVVDADEGNLITRGRNILDGPFKSIWNWDMQLENSVNQEAGTFYYRMATLEPTTRRAGTLARVFVHVLKPTRGPLLDWIWNPGAAASQPQTTVLSLGKDLYAARFDPSAVASADLPGDNARREYATYEKADPETYRF